MTLPVIRCLRCRKHLQRSDEVIVITTEVPCTLISKTGIVHSTNTVTKTYCIACQPS